MISSEEIYDREVSPLVKKLVHACASSKPPIPVLACSTFWNSEREREGSCSSASLKGNASLRMKEIFQIIGRSGKTPVSAMAKMMRGKPAKQELDADWYEFTDETGLYFIDKIAPLLKQIDQLVSVTYHFPTAIVVQAPVKGLYMVVGAYPSESYQGIQFARVIANHGYGQIGSAELMGGPVSRAESPVIKKEVKVVVPLLRGNTPPPQPTREEVRTAKYHARMDEQDLEHIKREQALVKKRSLDRKKKRSKKKRRVKKEGRWRTTNILDL